MEKSNSKSIFNHLCTQMRKLDQKLITVDEARSHSDLAKQANNLLKYELERAKTMEKFSGNFREIEE